MLKKMLMALVALFFVLAGGLILIMGYVFNNPDSVFTAFQSVTDKFLQGQKYEEQGEFFLQGISELTLHSRSVDFVVKTHTGPTMKVLLHGKVPRFEQGPFILQMAEQNTLRVDFHAPFAGSWIQMNVNGEEYTHESDSKLTAEVHLPHTYKGHVFVKTETGHVSLRLPANSFYELELLSRSGEIKNNFKQKPTSEVNPQEVGHIKIDTDTGPILVENED